MLMYFFIQILLVILKITKTIDWSWEIVLIPTWIAFGILAMYLMFCTCTLIALAVSMCF